MTKQEDLVVYKGEQYINEIIVDYRLYDPEEIETIEEWFGRSGGLNSVTYSQIDKEKYYLVDSELACYADSTTPQVVFDGEVYEM